MPEYDLGILITLNIGLTLTGILAAMIGVWAIIRQNLHSQAIALHVAQIAERIDARLHRQYADIDRDLREIKDLLEGQ